MVIKLTKNEYNWLRKNYPSLKFIKSKGIIQGKLYFNREYNGIVINDCYEIEIKLEQKKNSILPQVKELNGKLDKMASELTEPLIDQHVNEADKTLCLCIPEMEKEYLPNGFKIDVFFEKILIPYLYWASYKRKFKKAPWGEYAHGDLGYLELYAENKIALEKLMEMYSESELKNISRMKGHNNCLCDSGKKVRGCHKLIYVAIHKLRKNLI